MQIAKNTFENKRVLQSGVYVYSHNSCSSAWANPFAHLCVIDKKVKLSLCLTMHRDMKTYWGSGS